MKVVRIVGGIVQEIIPEYALPVEKWYGASFAAQCVEAPDEAEQYWVYDAESRTFSKPEPVEELTDNATLEYRIAALEAQLAETDEAIIALFEAQGG